jgi:hypothetical protein
MIRVVKDSSAMQRNLRATSCYSSNGWKVYEESRSDLEATFKALKRIRFEADWEEQAKPRIEKTRADIARDLPKYNVIPKVESVLGTPCASNKITVYLLHYSEPHGIKIIHVLAVALYSSMKQQHFADGHEAFPVFLKRMIRSGALSNGGIQELDRAFLAN